MASDVENGPYSEFLSRSVRALGRRVAAGDPEDLRTITRLRAEVDDAMAWALAGLREQGYSWDEIGRAWGVTRQGAWKWAREHGVPLDSM